MKGNLLSMKGSSAKQKALMDGETSQEDMDDQKDDLQEYFEAEKPEP